MTLLSQPLQDIGTGSFGNVLLARNVRTNEQVSLTAAAAHTYTMLDTAGTADARQLMSVPAPANSMHACVC